MKAVRVHAPGGPEAMKLEDVPEPTPKAGEAVVKVDAAGLNYIDVYQRSGLYKLDMPLTLGLEAGGTVTAVGQGVTEVKPGDRVAYTGVPGAYAQYAAVPAARLVVLPQGVSSRTTSRARPIRSRTATPASCTPPPAASASCSARWPRCAARASSARCPRRRRPSSRARPAPTR
jgi:D-arabinose 1-dehydrogenase-like Zn-dependent alcohol dehydrogenase